MLLVRQRARRGAEATSAPHADASARRRYRALPAGQLNRIGSGLTWPLLLILLSAVLLVNIGLGAVRIDTASIVAVLAHRVVEALLAVPGMERTVVAEGLRNWAQADVNPTQASVIWHIRLPRALLGALIGAGLGISGATLQGVFRNPLADPGIIGVSAGASVGAVAAIVLGIGWFGIWTLPIFAFVTASAVTMVVYAIARRGGRTEVVTLILAGVAISSVAGGFVGWLVTIADDEQLRNISFWQMGSLGGAQWPQVCVVATCVATGALYLTRTANALNIMTLGEREAQHLGLRVERIRRLAMFTTAAMTGAAVAFAGAIGFVGLVVPHLVRLLWGPDHRQLLPKSLVLGAIVLLLADLVSRLAVAPMELPVGVVMGLVGGPFFGWLLLRTRRSQGGWA